MALPIVPLGTDTVRVGETDVAYRSLSRQEVVALSRMDDDPNAAETYMVARATGVTDEEAKAWLSSVDAATADGLLVAIAVLSGIRRQGNP